MKPLMLPLLASFLLSACSFVGIRSGLEQPAYDVVETRAGDVEVRRYPEAVVVEASVPAADRDAGENAAFRLLFDYISGANSVNATIAMTAPVETAGRSVKIDMTVPVETSAEKDGDVRMQFFLPAVYDLKSAPQPTDPRVRILQRPERLVAALRFSGSTHQSAVALKRQELLESLAGTNWRPAGDAVTLYYDPPWTLPFLRRNEVAVPVDR